MMCSVTPEADKSLNSLVFHTVAFSAFFSVSLGSQPLETEFIAAIERQRRALGLAPNGPMPPVQLLPSYAAQLPTPMAQSVQQSGAVGHLWVVFGRCIGRNDSCGKKRYSANRNLRCYSVERKG
jgi:hypothetical protein